MSEYRLLPDEKHRCCENFRGFGALSPVCRGWTWREPAPNLTMGPFTLPRLQHAAQGTACRYRPRIIWRRGPAAHAGHHHRDLKCRFEDAHSPRGGAPRRGSHHGHPHVGTKPLRRPDRGHCRRAVAAFRSPASRCARREKRSTSSRTKWADPSTSTATSWRPIPRSCLQKASTAAIRNPANIT